jgi:hypothetical protein
MAEIKDFIALCRDGERKVKAWASRADSEIVAHHKIGFEGYFFDEFVLSHRRSGLAIQSYIYQFPTKAEAIAAADKIADFPEWKNVGRPPKFGQTPAGWSKKLVDSLRKKLITALPPTECEEKP